MILRSYDHTDTTELFNTTGIPIAEIESVWNETTKFHEYDFEFSFNYGIRHEISTGLRNQDPNDTESHHCVGLYSKEKPKIRIAACVIRENEEAYRVYTFGNLHETSYYYKFDHQPNLTTFSIHGSVLAMTIDGLVLRIPQAALFKFETKLKSSQSYKLIFTTDNQNLTSGTLWHTFRNKTFIYPANPFPVTDDGKDSLSKRFREIEEEESRAAVTLFRKIRIFVVTFIVSAFVIAILVCVLLSCVINDLRRNKRHVKRNFKMEGQLRDLNNLATGRIEIRHFKDAEVQEAIQKFRQNIQNKTLRFYIVEGNKNEV